MPFNVNNSNGRLTSRFAMLPETLSNPAQTKRFQGSVGSVLASVAFQLWPGSASLPLSVDKGQPLRVANPWRNCSLRLVQRTTAD